MINRLFVFAFSVLLSATRAFAQDASWFTNVTEQIGGADMDTVLNYRIYAVDVNNDDYPDLLLEYGNLTLNQLRLFINIADANGINGRAFTETTETSGINPPGRYADVAAVADFNNDGNVDFITNAWYHSAIINATQTACIPNPDDGSFSGVRLFLGDGAGHFTMQSNSGLEALPPMSGSALPLLDYNRDGNLDVLIGTWYTGWCSLTSDPNNQVPDAKYLMRGNGDGTFTDVTSQAGDIIAQNKGYFGANTADWNNDCNQDILTAPYTVDGNGNLLRNNGDGTFTDVAAAAGYNPHWLTGDNGQAMVPWEAMPYDYDNDGDMDFLVMLVHGGTGLSEGRSSIFTNQGAAAGFAMVPEISRMNRVAPQASHKGDHKGIWMDFDNNGLVDIVIGEGGYSVANERLYFLRQDANGTFNDITADLGWINGGIVSPYIKGPHAMEPIDFDLDGDDDLVVGCLYNAAADKRFLMLENKATTGNNRITVKLKAPPGVNSSCIGARVYVTAGGVTQMRDVYAGQGHFGGQQPFIMTFGIGTAASVDSVVVRWPDAFCSRTVITDNIPVNQLIAISGSGIGSSVPAAATFENTLSVYPNPASGEIISVKSESIPDGDIFISDVHGRVVLSQNFSGNQSANFTLSIGQLPSGVYALSLKSRSCVATRPFVIVR